MRNSGRILVVVLVVLSLAGCITFTPPPTGNTLISKNAVQDWVTSEQALVAAVVPSDPDGDLKIRVQYELTKTPVLTWDDDGLTHMYHDPARQPKKEMIDVPVGDKIAIQGKSYWALVKEPGYVKYDKAKLVEFFFYGYKASDISEVVSVHPDTLHSQNDREWRVRSEKITEYIRGDVGSHRQIQIKPGTIDITSYQDMLYAESEKRVEAIKATIAAMDKKYPLNTSTGLSGYERELQDIIYATHALEPEKAVIEKAINARRIAINTMLAEERKIATTPNEFAQLGSYSFSTPTSTVHVLLLPEGKAVIVILYAKSPNRQFLGGWRRTDNGFRAYGDGLASSLVFVKTGNTYKVTEDKTTYDKVEFNRNASTVVTGGTYLRVETVPSGRQAFVFGAANTVEVLNVTDYGTNIVSVAKGTYTIKDDIILIEAGGMRFWCRIVGSRFLAWNNAPDSYSVFSNSYSALSN